jgi:hypothetical protein
MEQPLSNKNDSLIFNMALQTIEYYLHGDQMFEGSVETKIFVLGNLEVGLTG